MKTKICSKCGEEKDLDKFNKDSSKKDGYYSSCKECQNKQGQIYYLNNKNKINQRHKDNYNKNKSEYSKRHIIYNSKRRKEDPAFKTIHNFRRRLLRALEGKLKISSSLELLGCTPKELKQHLESQFKEGMSWDNYGLHGWHIDHIKPLALFDLSKGEEQRKAFHYTNLQPLWAEENWSKGCKIL